MRDALMFYVAQIGPAPPGEALGKEEQHIAARMWGSWMDLTRSNASQNVHRFYRIEVMPGLWGDWALVREWSRIGQPGQVRLR